MTPDGDGASVRQQALFAPSGVFGRLYWYAMLPFHAMIFPTMVENLARTAERVATSSGAPTTPPAEHGGRRAAAARGRRRARRAG